MSLHCGFKTVTPIQLANVLHAVNSKLITYKGARVFFACLLMLAAREAAGRSQKQKGKRLQCRYRQEEVCGLTGLSSAVVKRELRALQRLKILSFSESMLAIQGASIQGSESFCQRISGRRSPKRPIPVLRCALRFLARSNRTCLGKTTIAYILRGLTIERQNSEVRGVGTVKASWIAKTMCLSARSVKSARKELIDSGFITKDTNSYQRKLNRDGAYFRINLAWKEKPKQGVTPPKISPRRAETHPNFAPPYKDKKTSYESKNQKTLNFASKPPGVCKANHEEEPTLRDVKPEDLKRFSRLKTLFMQAVEAGWLRGSEANFLNWLAAAVRAQTVEARSPVRVFLGIVKKGRWEFITQAQEDRARAAFTRNREKYNPTQSRLMFHEAKKLTEGVVVTLSRLKL